MYVQDSNIKMNITHIAINVINIFKLNSQNIGQKKEMQ